MGEVTLTEVEFSKIRTDRFANIRTGKTDRKALQNSREWHGEFSAPVLCGPLEDGTYDVVAGFGRFEVMKKANGKKSAQFFVRAEIASKRAINLVENMARSELHWSEIAMAIQEVKTDSPSDTQQALAQKCGVSQSLVSECLRMSPKILELAGQLRAKGEEIVLTHEQALGLSKEIANGAEYTDKELRDFLKCGIAEVSDDAEDDGDDDCAEERDSTPRETYQGQSPAALHAMYASVFEQHKELKKSDKPETEELARLGAMVEILKWATKTTKNPPKGVQYEPPKRGRKSVD